MDLTLENREWKEFLISEIFEVTGTYTTHPKELRKGGNVPRITCAATNNAFENTYRNKATEKGGVITIDSATVGYVSYQSTDFIATDHVEKITLKKNKVMNRYLGLFFVQIITTASLNKYGYGYKFSQTRIIKQKILLPTDSKGEPDYEFMENYMKHKEQEKLKKYKDYIQNRLEKLKNTPKTVSLDKKEWKEFFIEEIFTKMQRGKRLIVRHRIKGNIPFVTAGFTNQGVAELIQNQEQETFSNSITIDMFGNVFYRNYFFKCDDNIHVMSNSTINSNNGNFIVNCIQQTTKDIFSYGKQFRLKTLEKLKILLPVNSKNEPDYEFMENYIKNLEYRKLSTYLDL